MCSPAGSATQKRPRLSVRTVSDGCITWTRAPSIGAPDSSATRPQRSGSDWSPTVSVEGAGAVDGCDGDSCTSVLVCTGMNVIECSTPAALPPSSSDRDSSDATRGVRVCAGACGLGLGAGFTGATATGAGGGITLSACATVEVSLFAWVLSAVTGSAR